LRTFLRVGGTSMFLARQRFQPFGEDYHPHFRNNSSFVNLVADLCVIHKHPKSQARTVRRCLMRWNMLLALRTLPIRIPSLAHREVHATLSSRLAFVRVHRTAPKILRKISARCRDEPGCAEPYRPFDRWLGKLIQTNILGTFTLLQGALRYWRNQSPNKRAQF